MGTVEEYGRRNDGGRRTGSGQTRAARQASGGPAGAPCPAGGRQARARAMARRRRRRRQRRMVIGGLVLLLVLIAAGIFFGVSSYKKGKAQENLLKEGVASLESGNYGEAIGKFNEILDGSKGKVGSFEAEVLTYRGEAEYKQKDYNAALKTFELLEKEDGGKERYKRMICYSQLELGNYGEALALGYADALAYSRLALRDIENKEYDAALENVQKGIAACEADDPARQELLYSQAVIYEQKGDFAKALELFEAYLEAYGPDEKAEREATFLKTRQGGA